MTLTRIVMNGHFGSKFRLLLPTFLIAVSASCADVAYYRQAAYGQWRLLNARRPLEGMLTNPATAPALRQHLELARALRDFASQELALPDNGSYRSYADLKRPYVLKNVFAAPELSLELQRWCFPVVGCVVYRGYFDPVAAQHLADSLRAAGEDVYVADISAYSSLGWFDDPLLNTFVNWPAGQLGELIFHELAHQRLYIAGDSAFNESFANAVSAIGVRLWLERQGTAREREVYAVFSRRRQAFMKLVMATREELERLYASAQDPEAKRQGKRRLLTELRQRYETLKKGWGGYGGYDLWFDRDLNNAKLAALDTYSIYVPAFEALFDRVGRDFKAFYSAAETLGKLPVAARQAKLQDLRASLQLAMFGNAGQAQ